MSIIDKQKLVATKILHKLECADPHAILAGGAPRDWYFNRPANDLDFYIHLPHSTCGADELRWKRLGLNLSHVPYEKKEHNQYKCMPDLFRMYEGEEDGVKFQVMIMLTPTFDSVIPYFGNSLCKVWWKGDAIKTSIPFLMTLNTGKIYVEEGYLATDYHIEKVSNYYPNFNLCFSKDEYEMDKIELANKFGCSHTVWAFERNLEKRAENYL